MYRETIYWIYFAVILFVVIFIIIVFMSQLKISHGVNETISNWTFKSNFVLEGALRESHLFTCDLGLYYITILIYTHLHHQFRWKITNSSWRSVKKIQIKAEHQKSGNQRVRDEKKLPKKINEKQIKLFQYFSNQTICQ